MRTVTYQSSRQSSNHVKVHSGNAVRNYKSRYGKGIRPTYTVLQIKADSPVNGADVFWYEGNCSILGSKNVYIENMLQSDKKLFMKKKVPVFYSPKDVNRCIVYLEDSQ